MPLLPGQGPHPSGRGGPSSQKLRRLLFGLLGLRRWGPVSRPFLTLAIESSCDDTSVALLEGSRRVRATALASQIALHAPWGGVIPETASREHLRTLIPLLREVLRRGGVANAPRELSLVAVTAGPGLMGSLLVGVMAAKALAQAWELPIVGINHLEGHLFANVVAHDDLVPPFLALIVSGGHTEIVHVRAFGDYRLLGMTRDDAVGEAYDKVAKLLGLPYPGGPAIDDLARKGNPKAFPLPVPMKDSDAVEFSYSGLKTAVLWLLRRFEGAEIPLEDICASFQEAALAALMAKVRLAVARTGVRSVVLSGGVAANSSLRERMAAARQWKSYIPPRDLCTDNAVMIAAAGYNNWKRGVRSDLTLTPDPSWPLASP
ncbi:tRNA (adenosine(37)-N6)-threonylcarbamoyltransferase complex transferase subunit TsaD [Aminithiophilus ramosus]|uniref:tRNA N6-adenosine threonylcarbamoyltransferase n=2 Tax=Synergistales TaxID=649776 RepID=A0A9Q7ADW5_9BACT|nr:tRNA (adenosine(37)-N6)-threonylcarbamoyltransferase complex transferase subunit TsaD [Aminithiophilus ramosus]QVL35386.1 tRNA (adenosine(37)-N6)-threonylcarbamoyltransferase complex transferase subunit TsaD [Synergistota bacterium]